MKNLMLISCVALIGFSCSKDPLNFNSESNKKGSFADFENGIEWAVSCSGVCEPQGDCSYLKVGTNSYECPCESCFLEILLVGEQSEERSISKDDANAMLANLLAENGTFLNELNDHVFSSFGTNTYEVTRVNMLTQDNYFGLNYSFNLEDGNTASVSFLKSLGEVGAEPIKIKVDCSGPCDLPTAKCRERWVPGNPPSAECTCEGECSMTVESLPYSEE
tara:strand:+ start:973 stop:1632 length:660 start_codon:yes stop_codon:yes gene_type:complete